MWYAKLKVTRSISYLPRTGRSRLGAQIIQTEIQIIQMPSWEIPCSQSADPHMNCWFRRHQYTVSYINEFFSMRTKSRFECMLFGNGVLFCSCYVTGSGNKQSTDVHIKTWIRHMLFKIKDMCLCVIFSVFCVFVIRKDILGHPLYKVEDHS